MHNYIICTDLDAVGTPARCVKWQNAKALRNCKWFVRENPQCPRATHRRNTTAYDARHDIGIGRVGEGIRQRTRVSNA